MRGALTRDGFVSDVERANYNGNVSRTHHAPRTTLWDGTAAPERFSTDVLLPNEVEQSWFSVTFPRSPVTDRPAHSSGPPRAICRNLSEAAACLAGWLIQWILTTLARAGAADTSKAVKTSVTNVKMRRILDLLPGEHAGRVSHPYLMGRRGIGRTRRSCRQPTLVMSTAAASAHPGAGASQFGHVPSDRCHAHPQGHCDILNPWVRSLLTGLV